MKALLNAFAWILGCTVVITGGSRGLSFEMARDFFTLGPTSRSVPANSTNVDRRRGTFSTETEDELNGHQVLTEIRHKLRRNIWADFREVVLLVIIVGFSPSSLFISASMRRGMSGH